MNARQCLNILAGMVTLVTVGCMPEMSIEMMKEMMPQRPAELDQLNVFAGDWKTTSEMNMPGLDETLKGTGTLSAKWDLDRWVLVQHGEFQMGDLGTMHGLEFWTWDAKSKVFRTEWRDNFGNSGEGTAKPYTDDGMHWKIKATIKGPWGTQFASGTIHFTDKDHNEWTWSEWPWWDVFRTMKTDMKGTGTRK